MIYLHSHSVLDFQKKILRPGGPQVFFFGRQNKYSSRQKSYLRTNCVRGTRTQPLICVGCSVHYWVSCVINKGGFFEIAFVVVVDTHLPRFEALAYVLPHFDALTHVVIRVSSAFIFQTFAEVCYSVFVKRSPFKSLLNLRKAYIFQEFAEGLLSICVCWIFQNVHLSKVSAAVVPQSKSTEMWSSAAPFHHDLWYFRHRTNEHFRSMLFIRKNL